MAVNEPTPEQVSQASYHLAGHFIVAHHFGFSLTQPAPGYCCRIENDTLPNGKEYEWVIILMAGRAGRKLAPILNWHHRTPEYHWKSTFDEFEASDMLEMLGDRTTSVKTEQIQLAEEQAREILLQKRETLDFLAEALIESSSMTFDDARAIIEMTTTAQ